jgi:hypothetical protein
MDVSFPESDVVLQGLTGERIATVGGAQYFAYQNLNDLHFSVSRWSGTGVLSTRESYEIQSVPAPLKLERGQSDVGGAASILVYSGALQVSWSRKRWALSSSNHGSAACEVLVRLHARENPSDSARLSCFDPADPRDASGLICLEMTLHIPVGTRICNASLKAKSNFPFQQSSPQPFRLRNIVLSFDPAFLFG